MCRVLRRHVLSEANKGKLIEVVATYLNPATRLAWRSVRVCIKNASDDMQDTSEAAIRGKIVAIVEHVVATSVKMELQEAASKCDALKPRVQNFSAHEGTKRLFATNEALESEGVVGVSTLLGGAAEISVYIDGEHAFRLPEGLDAPPLPLIDMDDDDWEESFHVEVKRARANKARTQLGQLGAMRNGVLAKVARASSSASLPSELTHLPSFTISVAAVIVHFDAVRDKEM